MCYNSVIVHNYLPCWESPRQLCSMPYVSNFWIRDSSADIVTGKQVGSPAEWIRAVSPQVSRRALGPTQPTVQWVSGIKRLGREADHGKEHLCHL